MASYYSELTQQFCSLGEKAVSHPIPSLCFLCFCFAIVSVFFFGRNRGDDIDNSGNPAFNRNIYFITNIFCRHTLKPIQCSKPPVLFQTVQEKKNMTTTGRTEIT